MTVELCKYFFLIRPALMLKHLRSVGGCQSDVSRGHSFLDHAQLLRCQPILGIHWHFIFHNLLCLNGLGHEWLIGGSTHLFLKAFLADFNCDFLVVKIAVGLGVVNGGLHLWLSSIFAWHPSHLHRGQPLRNAARADLLGLTYHRWVDGTPTVDVFVLFIGCTYEFCRLHALPIENSGHRRLLASFRT